MGVAGGWTVEGAQSLAAALINGAARVDPLMAQVVVKSATDLNSLTQRNASGRPGPNAPTGDYRGSWRVEVTARRGAVGSEVSASAGTDRAQANRLEYGFVGTDSLGRTYGQAPLPHHGPAVDVIDPIFELAMTKVAEQAVRW